VRIRMQAGGAATELAFSGWGAAVVGEAVDPRGTAAIEFAKGNSGVVHTFRYDPKQLAVEVDGRAFSAEEPEKPFAALGGPILLETTTLGFVEILLCCRGLKAAGAASVWLVYAEPQDYNRPRRSQIVHRRDFDLSDEVEEFTAVPGNPLLLLPEREVRAVIFLGFESQRLNRFLDQTSIAPGCCEFVFGVPAFRPGWEMDSFANNFRVLKGEKMAGRVHFCGAHSPVSAYEALVRIYGACSSQRVSVAPIGTKPHGVGAALFLCEHPDVGVVYDNPKRKKERSSKVGTWHLFEAVF
jgi:hypothetical protein